MLIREASPDDWERIWPVVEAVVRGGRTYTYPQDLTSAQARDLWFEGAPSRVFVAERDDVVLGTAKTGPNRPGRGAHVATASFMVDPGAQGQGVGRALADRVLASATADGYRLMQFNAVVESNHAAVHLWQDLGFRIVGTVPEAFDHPDDGFVGLHVMVKDLRA